MFHLLPFCIIYKIPQLLVAHQARFYQHNLSKPTVDASVASTRKRQKLAKRDSVFNMQTVARKILLLLSVRCRTRSRFPHSSPDTIINAIKGNSYAVPDRSCHSYHSCNWGGYHSYHSCLWGSVVLDTSSLRAWQAFEQEKMTELSSAVEGDRPGSVCAPVIILPFSFNFKGLQGRLHAFWEILNFKLWKVKHKIDWKLIVRSSLQHSFLARKKYHLAILVIV